MEYYHFGQRFLKVSDSCVGDPRAAEVQLSEVGQALQMHQPEVANAGSVFEAECFEAGQPLEAFQALVGDLRATEIQPSELDKPFEVFEAVVSDLGSAGTSRLVNPLM